MRWSRLLAAFAIVFLTAVPAAAAEDGLTIDFRLGRRPLTRTLTVTLRPTGESTDVEDPTVRLTSDLNGPSGQFPSSQLTLSATALGGPLVQVTGVADPLAPEQVRHGVYTGRLLVGAEGFAPQTFPVTINVGDRSRGYHVPRVLATLLLGGIFGTVAKWLNDTGLALYPIRRRFREVDDKLENIRTALPRTFTAVHKSAGNAIREGDVAAAEADVALLEVHVNNALRLAPAIKRLADTHRAHVALAKDRRIEHVDQVREILATEAARIEALRRTPLANLASALRDAARDERRAAFVGEVLRSVHPAGRPAKLRGVLSKLCQHDFAAAATAWAGIDDATKHTWATEAEKVVAPAEAPVAATGEAPSGTTGRRRRATSRRRVLAGWWHAVQEHVVAHVRFYAGALLVLFTAFVGYNERYLDDPSFVGRQSQYFGLFFYAAAIPLGGLQVAQLVGRVWPSPGSSRTAPPPAAEPPVEPGAAEAADPEEGEPEPDTDAVE